MPRALHVLAAGLAAALALAGCRKGAAREDTCEAAGERFVANLHRDLDAALGRGELGSENHARTSAHVPAMRDAMVRHCKEDAWPAEARACFARAADGDAATACYQAMAPEHRESLEKAAAGAL